MSPTPNPHGPYVTAREPFDAITHPATPPAWMPRLLAVTPELCRQRPRRPHEPHDYAAYARAKASSDIERASIASARELLGEEHFVPEPPPADAPPLDDKLVSIGAVARALGVKRDRVRRLIREGVLPPPPARVTPVTPR